MRSLKSRFKLISTVLLVQLLIITIVSIFSYYVLYSPIKEVRLENIESILSFALAYGMGSIIAIVSFLIISCIFYAIKKDKKEIEITEYSDLKVGDIVLCKKHSYESDLFHNHLSGELIVHIVHKTLGEITAIEVKSTDESKIFDTVDNTIILLLYESVIVKVE